MADENRVKLLLVDDNHNNLVALSAILSSPQYELVTANSGPEALELLLKEEFAVVLLDVMMPEMDGFEVAREIRQHLDKQHTPIIFVTAVAQDVSDIYKGYSVGAVDYLQKPLDELVVRAKVGIFAELYRKNKEIQRQASIILDSEKALSLQRERAARVRAEAAERRECTAKLQAEASEQRFHDLINWVDHAVIWEFDAVNFRFSFVSQRAREIVGHSAEAWTNSVDFFFEHVPEEDREIVRNVFQDGVHGKDSRCEHRYIRANGEVAWLHTGVNPRKNQNGKVVLLWGMSVEISPLKISEEHNKFLAEVGALLSSSLNYQVILDRLVHLFVPRVADWSVIDLLRENGQFDRAVVAHSDPAKENVALELKKRFPPTADGKGISGEALQTGKPVLMAEVSGPVLQEIASSQEHLELLRSLAVRCLVSVPLHAKGRVIGAITFVRGESGRKFAAADVPFLEELSRRVAFAIENADLYEAAQKAIRLRDDLLAVVSHDLKNPLTAIKLSCSTIERIALKKLEPSAIVELGKRIGSSADRMEKMIGDFLEMTKIEAGAIRFEKNPQQVFTLVNEAVDPLRPLAERKSIHVLNESDDKGGVIIADKEAVFRVFSNLIGNAINFTPNGGQITIQADPKDHEVEFSVSDTGPGVPDEHLPFIFDRFWQAKHEFRKGAGLGLAIAKGLVEAQGGRIWIKSKLGTGSTFYFTLPRQEIIDESLSAG
jgi:PAS domain S-box-containing protein